MKKKKVSSLSCQFDPSHNLLYIVVDAHMHIIPNQSFVTVHISDRGSRPHYKLNVANPTYYMCGGRGIYV